MLLLTCWPITGPSRNFKMGRDNPKHHKLLFKQAKPTRHQGSHSDDGLDRDTGAEMTHGKAAIMAGLRTEFGSIDTRYNALTSGLDRIDESLDRQATGLNSKEDCVSGLEDRAAAIVKHLEKADRLLKMVAAKIEDLKVYSCHNHLGINHLGIMGIGDSPIWATLACLLGSSWQKYSTPRAYFNFCGGASTLFSGP
ncbi:hypothetical protein NDU88_004167 [Pleurodeles waltl]|uniref:Uncharacterized protein n=1 Tax=Pleurodeles waltl TaxID=8319 RepID=A0AAV7VFE9_PLEWA|nr:hypothetical protein NDU88_004167 [Pleurodeles waltl]